MERNDLLEAGGLRLPLLGERLFSILSLVPHTHLAAEIGADHGILSAHALARGICAHMTVSDVSAASLLKAKRLFARHGLSDRADFVVADGLRAIQKPTHAIIIAGMGGGTMLRILEEGAACLQGATLVLSPNLDHSMLRTYLSSIGYRIDAETLMREGGRFYVAMRAVPGVCRHSDMELSVGPCLLSDRPALLLPYLTWRRGCLSVMRGEKAQAEMEHVDAALAMLKL